MNRTTRKCNLFGDQWNSFWHVSAFQISNSQLQILKTGNVEGDINYARLEVLTGGILSGNVDVFSEGKEKENAKL